MEPDRDSPRSSEPEQTAGGADEDNYGVKSLGDTLEDTFGQDSKTADEMIIGGSGLSTPGKDRAVSAIATIPRSGSVNSLKLSDEESFGLSGEEEDHGTHDETPQTSPQLVMPSIQMPTRRPFTERGRAMGKLKILIAGGSGVGKTSLVRSIVQLCEDIVHVDPSPPTRSNKRKRSRDGNSTTCITEIHASTKAYPHWWTEAEDSCFRRRRSLSDAVLERNVTFVDTPGFGRSASSVEDQNLVVDYVESLLYQNASVPSMEDSDLLGVISGNGGVQVDLVLYLLGPGELPTHM